MAREVAAVLGIVVAILVVALHQPTRHPAPHEYEPALADGDGPDEVPVLASAADGI